MVALRAKHLAIIIPAIFAAFIGLAVATGRWNAASGRRFSDLVGRDSSGPGRGSGAAAGRGAGPGGATEGRGDGADEHDPADRIVWGSTTFADLAEWGIDMEAVKTLVGGSLGAPGTTVRDWCMGRGIGFGQVKGSIQALADATGP